MCLTEASFFLRGAVVRPSSHLTWNSNSMPVGDAKESGLETVKYRTPVHEISVALSLEVRLT